MKLTAIILLSATLAASATGNAQRITLLEKNAPITDVFKSIKQQTGVTFYYQVELLNQAKPVTIDVKDASLEKVLDICFSNQPFTYELVGLTVVIRQKTVTKIDDSVINEPSPSIDVHGKVVNEKGEPVEGVSVRIKGTKTGTSTDANGYFEIKGIDQNATLSFTSTNMEPFEIKIDGKNDLSISLKTKITALGDVQLKVNTGYQQLNRERFVGATGGLDSAAFHRRDGALRIIDRLDGTVAGILFDKKSGGLNPYQIRGVSTINNSQAPLIILDNFPFAGDLNSINVNDIESISILKDAASASIWGSRAGNGVIVITTKKGKYNQPLRISVSSNVTITEKPNLYYYPQMSSSDFIDVEETLFSKGFYDGDLANTTNRPIISPVVELLNKVRNGSITQADADAQINSMRNQDIRSDLKKYVYQPAVTQQHYININGGSNNFSYALSGGYNRTLPNIQYTKPSEQYTFNSNTRIKPIKNLEVEAGINFSQNNQVQPAVPIQSNKIYPYAQLADEEGKALAIPYNYRVSYLDTAGGGRLLDWRYRPLDELGLADNTSKARFIKVNFGINYKLTSWLNADVKYQYIDQTTIGRTYYSPQTFYARDLINRYTNLSQPDPNLRNPVPLGGIVDLSNISSKSSNIRGQLNFNKNWTSRHLLTGLIAGEIGETKGDGNSARFYGFNSTVGTYQSNIDYTNPYPVFASITGSGAAVIPNNNILQPNTVNRFVSLLANLSYTYNNRYTVYTSARRDGANVFGVNTNNKWKPLWSAGASWDIAKESFYHVYWLSSLRLRGSFGYTGNAGTVSGLPTIAYLPYTTDYSNLTQAGPNTAPNPDLKWEQVRTYNAGIDFSALKSRLSGSIDFFNKRSTDLIAGVPFDRTSGVSFYTVNSASLGGNGFELTLNSINTIGSLKWQTNFGLSYNKMIVTKLYNGGYKASDFIKYGLNAGVGKVAYGISSYRWAGLDPATGDPQGYLNGHVSKDYNAIFNDSVDNQVFNGSSIPLYSGFIGNSFTYKNFTLSANITYRLDFYFRKPSISYSSLFNGWQGHIDYEKRWQQPGDELHTNVPSMIYPIPSAVTQRDQFYSYSEVNVLRGDNIKLQDVRLQYSINRSIWKGLPLQSIQFFIYANNLNLIIWRKNKSDLDPDFSGGFNPTAAPSSKTWTGGVTINF